MLYNKGKHEFHQLEGGQRTGSRTVARCTLYNVGEVDIQKVLLALDFQPMHTLSPTEQDLHRQSMNVLEWWLAWCQTVPFSTQRIVRPALPRFLYPPCIPNTFVPLAS